MPREIYVNGKRVTYITDAELALIVKREVRSAREVRIAGLRGAHKPQPPPPKRCAL